MEDLDLIAAQVMKLPDVALWPEMASVFKRVGREPRADWSLPLLAARTVGSDTRRAVPAAASVACMQISIILVDDILDNDPRGEHLTIGTGAAANLALAFQSAAFQLIATSTIDLERQSKIMHLLSALSLTTARGQDLDVRSPISEEGYWNIIRTKSTPFYAAALQIGALSGHAAPRSAQTLEQFGAIFGEIIQIQDDLVDAFQVPANPDWKECRYNLAIIYASIANHPDQAIFRQLVAGIDDPDTLHEAQRILVASGAVSYCAYHLIRRRRRAMELLDDDAVADSTPLRELLVRQTETLVQLLQAGGAEQGARLLQDALI